MSIDTTFAEGIRAQLVETAAGTSPLAKRTHRRRLAIGAVASVAAVGFLTAGAVIVAGLPGEHIVTEVGAGVAASYTGTSTVQLGALPEGANAISFTITCASAGVFSVAFADGSGISWECSDTPGPRESTTEDPYDQTVPVGHVVNVKDQRLADGENSFVVETDPATQWSVAVRFANSVTTDWGVNANGDSYGVPNENGVPTLHAVLASNCEFGYVYFDDFMSDAGDDGGEQSHTIFKSDSGDGDEQAYAIPVYESDGETVVGEFWIGNDAPFCEK